MRFSAPAVHSLTCGFALLIGLGLVLAPHRAHASDAGEHAWVDPAGGLFSDGMNWQDGALMNIVPGSTDTAVFDLSTAGYTVTFGSNVTNDRLIVRTDDVTLDLSGFTYDATNGATGVAIGESATDVGLLTITGGTLSVTAALDVGNVSGATGTLTVNSGAAVLAVTMDINSGGTASVNGCGSVPSAKRLTVSSPRVRLEKTATSAVAGTAPPPLVATASSSTINGCQLCLGKADSFRCKEVRGRGG